MIAIIIAVALEVGVDPNLAVILAQRENAALNPSAISAPNENGTFDMGLMQLNSRYIESFVRDYWNKDWTFRWDNPYDNAYVALSHLKRLMARPGLNLWQSILCYNAGEANVRKGTVKSASVEYANAIYTAWQGANR